jgi:SSS family solute:Na+ symporter
MNIILMLLLVAVVGYVAYRSKGEDYFLTTSESNMNLGLSYGATLISTSAIIGFGGLAGWIGFAIPLTMVIPFVGLIYFATVYIGPKVHRANKEIKAKTYIEMIGKHYNSPMISKLLAIITVGLIPFYCVAVLIGVGKFITAFTGIDFALAVVGFSVVVFATIAYGGMNAVLKNDMVQGIIVIVGSLIVLAITVFSHMQAPGFWEHLASAWTAVPEGNALHKLGFTSFTTWPEFWSRGWLMIITLLVFTIPVGLITLPQLQTRWMLAKDEDSFKTIARWGIIIPGLAIVTFMLAAISANSYTFSTEGVTVAQAAGGTAGIVPYWIKTGFPAWVSSALFVTILAAAFTTLNSLMHLLSTTISNDIISTERPKLKIAYASMIAVILLALWMTVQFNGQMAIIARATALYFGIIGAAMLPLVIGFARGLTNGRHALASFIGGATTSIIWVLFVHFKESKLFTGITYDLGVYNFVEPIVPGLIVSSIILIAATKLRTQK